MAPAQPCDDPSDTLALSLRLHTDSFSLYSLALSFSHARRRTRTHAHTHLVEPHALLHLFLRRGALPPLLLLRLAPRRYLLVLRLRLRLGRLAPRRVQLCALLLLGGE